MRIPTHAGAPKGAPGAAHDAAAEPAVERAPGQGVERAPEQARNRAPEPAPATAPGARPPGRPASAAADGPVPPVPRLKDQAARLRARAQARGEAMSHAQSLEALARLMGRADWNTLRAAAVAGPAGAPLAAEEKVWARYMGSAPIKAKVLAVRAGAEPGLWRVQIAFAEALEGKGLPAVLEDRARLSAEVDGAGVSAARRSDGVPHLALELR